MGKHAPGTGQRLLRRLVVQSASCIILRTGNSVRDRQSTCRWAPKQCSTFPGSRRKPSTRSWQSADRGLLPRCDCRRRRTGTIGDEIRPCRSMRPKGQTSRFEIRSGYWAPTETPGVSPFSVGSRFSWSTTGQNAEETPRQARLTVANGDRNKIPAPDDSGAGGPQALPVHPWLERQVGRALN